MLCSPGHCQWLGLLLGSRSGSVRLQSSILVRIPVNIIVASNLVDITLRTLLSIIVSILVRRPWGACWMVAEGGEGENPLPFSLTAPKRGGGGWGGGGGG